jgi:peptidoglycan/LPS O-acetylase OafA/YrhL
MPPASPAAPNYQPELMGIRAVAVGLVVLVHWVLSPWPFGSPGRMLFLVLSGYLISGSVWKNDIYWGGAGAWGRRLGVFYLRRALRIMPAYYAALGLAAALPLVTLHQYPLWFLLPAANLLCYRLQSWPEGLGHYWTLAVEEQFYLLWPLLLTLFRRLRATEAGLWTIIGLAFLFRAAWVWAAGPGFVTVLLPACLDLFAAGALLRLQVPRLRAAGSGFSGGLVAAAWLAWATGWHLSQLGAVGDLYWAVAGHSLGALASYCTLRWLLTAPPAARWLRHPVAQWLGERSYGLYLYHLLLPVFYQRLVYHLLPASLPNAASLRHFWLSPLPTVLLLTPVLVGLSAASWRWLEAPLDRFRRQFAYPRPTAKPLATIAD